MNSCCCMNFTVACFDKMSIKSDESSISSLSEDFESQTDCQECFEIPDQEVVEKVLKQVESYFTDENLSRDEFMLKNIRRNKEGFVNISLIASQRRVKSVIKNCPQPCRLISYAVDMFSDKIELNSDGTKIRRKVPLPPIDGNRLNRTIMIVGLPKEKSNIEMILDDFSAFGPIDSVRFFNSKNIVSNNQNRLLKHLKSQSIKIGEDQIIATVEFSTLNDALRCMESKHLLAKLDPVWSQTDLHLPKTES